MFFTMWVQSSKMPQLNNKLQIIVVGKELYEHVEISGGKVFPEYIMFCNSLFSYIMFQFLRT